MNYKKAGFTHRKPKEPGVYFISASPVRPLECPRHIREGWTVAHIIYFAGSYSNVYDNQESAAFWQIQTLCGLCYAWKKGMWIKGPIAADWTARAAIDAAKGGKP